METVRRSRSDTKAQTRSDLIAAARSVFLARGFHQATLDEIAEQAGYTKGAVYSNFAGKDDSSSRCSRSTMCAAHGGVHGMCSSRSRTRARSRPTAPSRA